MPRVRLRTRGGPGGAVPHSLLAAGEPLATYELALGNPLDLEFHKLAIEGGLQELMHAEWPCEHQLGEHGEVMLRDGDHAAVFRLDSHTIASVSISHGWCRVRVASTRREEAGVALAAFSATYPPTYRTADDGGTVPITFWTNSQYGPTSRLRMIEAPTWADIDRNYSNAVRAQLGDLMEFAPGSTGQLILWQGPPGTGKTYALRALAHEWSAWAEFNYITDPDSFFVNDPSYMVNVLLHDSYEQLAQVDDGVEVVSSQREGKWRVLILEDTGELLASTAKDSYGQGLSRLLNVVDGLVGQGLRVLVLVTTNDELGELHPAVKRPGRCACSIEFQPLPPEEASAWTGSDEDAPATIAELYARGARPPVEPIVASAAEDWETVELEELVTLAAAPLDVDAELAG